MFSIQRMCESISESITSQLSIGQNEKEVIQYGLFAIIQTSIAILLSIVFGMIFGVLIPTLIISLTAVWLRKYSGGAHANTPEGCAVIGTIVSVGGALTVSLDGGIDAGIEIIGGVIFILALFIVYRLAPVDSKAKPIKKVEKRQMLRRKSIFVLSVYFSLCVLGFYLYKQSYSEKWMLYIKSIYVGVIWQVFTLTSIGHLALAKMDYLFNKLFNR